MNSLKKRWIALLAGPWVAGCGPEPTPEPACEAKSGVACVWAGTGTPGFNGDGKALRESRLYSPVDVAFAPDGTPWVIDFNNHRLRTVEANGTFRTRVGTNKPGDGDENLADLTPAGAPGLEVGLNHPTDLAFMPDGKVLFAAWHNFKIRSFDPKTETVHVLYGARLPMGGFAGDGGPAVDALFNFPKAVELAPDGTLYILDQRSLRIRKVANDAQRTVTTIAGDGTAAFAGDGGPPVQAKLKFESGNAPLPSGALALATDGSLYVADSLNHRIRRIDFAKDEITTVAGTGEAGLAGDGGPALAAKFNNPRDLEFGPDGRLYVADTDNHVVRAIDLASGVVTTVAGTGKEGAGAEGKAATATELHKPWGVAFDAAGALYVTDTENHRVLKVPR
jgi:sugar lactone lactonase YvrE